MNANSNSTDTLSSSKMNLSFFKKRITPKITQNFHKNSPIEEPKIFSTSRKTIEKQISKDIEERINILEKEFNNENITISQIKELLELCAVISLILYCKITYNLRKRLNIMNQ